MSKSPISLTVSLICVFKAILESFDSLFNVKAVIIMTYKLTQTFIAVTHITILHGYNNKNMFSVELEHEYLQKKGNDLKCVSELLHPLIK